MAAKRERVILIGGGATSALAAIRLAEHGFVVTVLEKAALGNGSSSRSNAGIRAQFGIEATAAGMMYSEDWYAHFHELLHTPPERRQPVIHQNGYLFLYEDPARAAPIWQNALRASAAAAWQRAQQYASMQQRIGLPVELLDPVEVHRRWPHTDPDRLVGATFCPTDGFLQPHIILTEGYRRARELGVTILTQTEVLGATLRGGRIAAIETTSGTLEADWYVNATNAWAPRVSRRLGGMPLPISPLKRYLYHVRLREPIMQETEWSRQPMTIYGLGVGRGALSRPDGPLLILAWAQETAPEPDFTDEDQDHIDAAFHHERGLENYGYAVLAQVADFVPRLADVAGLAATTSGFYGTTPDHEPLIGRDSQQANLVHAAGFSGHGLMHAPITALLVTAIVAGDVTSDGRVHLAPPYDRQTIDLATFDPRRDFTVSHKETLVL
jgi:glycine/D-amino acid oxidase-like deaminating enzyme